MESATLMCVCVDLLCCVEYVVACGGMCAGVCVLAWGRCVILYVHVLSISIQTNLTSQMRLQSGLSRMLGRSNALSGTHNTKRCSSIKLNTMTHDSSRCNALVRMHLV